MRAKTVAAKNLARTNECRLIFMRVLIVVSSLFLSIHLSIRAYAGETHESLLAHANRPTVAEIMDANMDRVHDSAGVHDSYWKALVHFASSLFGKSGFLESHGLRLATVIASFEKAYPGLTYAFLGRDSAFLADAVEAFYLAHGQIGRVVRLNASGNSINPANSNELLAFLRQNGFRPTAGGLERPYIIIDRTSYGLGSQSRRLLSAGYMSLLQTGASPDRLMRQFAVVNLGSDNNGVEMGPDIERDFFRRLKFLSGYRKSVAHEPITGPSTHLRISAGGLIDTAFWHDTFGKFEIAASGGLVAKPGAPMPEKQREESLEMIVEAVRAVSSDEFMAMVQRVARETFEYQFEFQQNSGAVVLPSQAELAIGADAIESRLAALEFLRWFDGPIAFRIDLLSRMKLMSPELIAERETLLGILGRGAFYEGFSVKLLQYVAALDLLISLEERRGEKEMKERAFVLLDDAVEALAIMNSRIKILEAKPRLAEAFSNALKNADGPAWRQVRAELEARWKAQIVDEAKPTEPGPRPGGRNILAKIADLKVKLTKFFRRNALAPIFGGSGSGPTPGAGGLNAESLDTNGERFVQSLGLSGKARACAAALKGASPGRLYLEPDGTLTKLR